jgi:hypothetical protein
VIRDILDSTQRAEDIVEVRRTLALYMFLLQLAIEAAEAEASKTTTLRKKVSRVAVSDASAATMIFFVSIKRIGTYYFSLSLSHFSPLNPQKARVTV